MENIIVSKRSPSLPSPHNQVFSMTHCKFAEFHLTFYETKDQARGPLGRNSGPSGRNFALNGTKGEVRVSLFFFFRETHFHSVTTQMQAVVTHFYHCIMFLLAFNGNSMCNGYFASKLTENAVILRYNFSLSDCHFSLNFLQVTSPYCQGQA